MDKSETNGLSRRQWDAVCAQILAMIWTGKYQIRTRSLLRTRSLHAALGAQRPLQWHVCPEPHMPGITQQVFEIDAEKSAIGDFQVLQLPDRPRGSVIEEFANAQCVSLRWPLPDNSRYSRKGCLARLFFMWFVLSVGSLGTIFRHHLRVEFENVVWFGCSTIFCVWLIRRVSRTVPESVRLEPEALSYNSGYNCFFEPDNLHHGTSRLKPKTAQRRPIQLARSEIHQVILDRVGERQRLSLDWGADRLEIGACLTEPEREWLFEALQAWHSPAKPTSDKA